ncbi:Serine/threonine-protein kinase rio2 [Cladobotryum mycophilum]|uniref:non-specific serine/threonine protein kinase n=1 Tax=Cladobotryum mycophilum TaxID=491253 RepID=A0ABR0T2K9_9HYPO
MKLDTRAMRHLASEDWRVLTAVELGSKNHEIVPTPLIEKLSRLRGGVNGVHRCISALAKVGLIARVKEAKYDGYRLTYGGLDYLALHTHANRKAVYSVGNRIGVGKESDIMVVADHSGTQCVLKIHRLGRISFRTVKSNRDYLKNKNAQSWMYLSRLAAMKEYAFMQALRDEGFPVPEPIAQSRHTIVMSLIDAFPLRQISEVPDPASLYADLISLILRLAGHGLIHGDYNEFNILVKEIKTTSEDGQETIKLEPVIIDFPQMVSMEHANAEDYFDRDVNCIKRFFLRRFHFTNAAVEASGFTKRMLKDLEAAIKAKEISKENGEAVDEDEDEEEEEDDDDDSETQEDQDGEFDVIGEGTVLSDGLAEDLLDEDSKAEPVEKIDKEMSRLVV